MHGSKRPPLGASLRMWARGVGAIKICPGLRRSLESDDVSERLFKVGALGVERAARHADADRAEEAAVGVEDGRGQTAEVLFELLALGGDTGQAHPAQVLG